MVNSVVNFDVSLVLCRKSKLVSQYALLLM